MNFIYSLLGIEVVSATSTPSTVDTIVDNAGDVATGIVGILTTFSSWVVADPLIAVILGIAFAGLAVALLMRLWKGASLG